MDIYNVSQTLCIGSYSVLTQKIESMDSITYWENIFHITSQINVSKSHKELLRLNYILIDFKDMRASRETYQKTI